MYLSDVHSSGIPIQAHRAQITEDVTPLAVSDEGPLHAHVHQHLGAHLPG